MVLDAWKEFRLGLESCIVFTLQIFQHGNGQNHEASAACAASPRQTHYASNPMTRTQDETLETYTWVLPGYALKTCWAREPSCYALSMSSKNLAVSFLRSVLFFQVESDARHGSPLFIRSHTASTRALMWAGVKNVTRYTRKSIHRHCNSMSFTTTFGRILIRRLSW